MAEILSQDEVDALLNGLTGGTIEAETDEPASKGGASSYDFTNQDRIIRGRMPTLEMIHDRFARIFRTTISASLHRSVDVAITGTALTKFGEFIRSLPVPTSLHLFKMEPLKGRGVLVVEGQLAFALVETYFGGHGGSRFKLEGREFTSIEQRIIRKVVDMVLSDYGDSWNPVHPVNIEFLRSETNPQFVNVVPPSDVVTVVDCELEMEGVSGRLIFCLPYSTLEPIRDKLRAGFQSESMEVDAAWLERLKSQLKGANVEVRVELGRTTLRGREVLDLQPGDIITLGEDYKRPLTIYFGGLPKLVGVAGSHSGKRGVQILGRWTPGR